jgi:hypothetical protein
VFGQNISEVTAGAILCLLTEGSVLGTRLFGTQHGAPWRA